MAVLVGATVETTSYPGIGDRVAAAQTFDNYLDGQPWAVSAQKIFFKESQWQTSLSNPQPVGELADAGAELLLCFQPSHLMTAADKVNLANTIAMFANAGIIFDVVLWQEPNTTIGQETFPTAADYITYFNYYAPTVQASGQNLVYCPGLSAASTAVSYYPGDTYVDKILVDYYCDAWAQKGTVLTDVMALADNHLPAPIPFGCAEIGTSSGSNVPTTAQFTGWLANHVQVPLLNRIAQGKAVDKVMWYSATNYWNVVNGSTPAAQITAMENLWTTLNSAGPSQTGVVGPDYTDFNGPQGTATAIGQTGVPLTTLAGTLIDSSTFSIPANEQVELAAVNISQLAYEVFVSASIANTATVPAVTVDMSWYDTTSGFLVAQEEWCIPAASSPNTYEVAGTGPTKGNQLIVTLTNLDPADAATVSITVLTNSRVLVKDRWIAVSTNNPPGLSASGAHLASGIVGATNATSVLSGHTFELLMGLYAGDVQFYMDQAGNSSANSTCLLQPWPTSKYGAAGIWSGNMSGGVGFGEAIVLRFPRVPLLLTYTNSGTSTAVINMHAVALDEAH